MNNRWAKKAFGAIGILALLSAGCMLTNAQSADSEKINNLFSNIRQHAAMAERDAELLESYTRSATSWESHSRRIASMKDHVNELGKDFGEAASLREEGSPWQQEALDRLQPLLKGMADHLSATIEHLNKNQNRIRLQPWKDYVRANYDYAVRASTLIRDYVDYGQAKAAADELETKLEITPSPSE